MGEAAVQATATCTNKAMHRCEGYGPFIVLILITRYLGDRTCILQTVLAYPKDKPLMLKVSENSLKINRGNVL